MIKWDVLLCLLLAHSLQGLIRTLLSSFKADTQVNH